MVSVSRRRIAARGTRKSVTMVWVTGRERERAAHVAYEPQAGVCVSRSRIAAHGTRKSVALVWVTGREREQHMLRMNRRPGSVFLGVGSPLMLPGNPFSSFKSPGDRSALMFPRSPWSESVCRGDRSPLMFPGNSCPWFESQVYELPGKP